MSSVPRKTSLVFTRESITPAAATRMLDNSNTAKRRPLSEAITKVYSHIMSLGEWCPDTGETIKISDDGEVVDGQHRLTALIASGKPVTMWVARGVPAEAFQFIDQGKARDLSDLLAIMGWHLPKVTAVTMRMLWRDSIKTGHPLSNPDADERIGESGIATFSAPYREEVSNMLKAYDLTLNNVQRAGFGAKSLLLYIRMKLDREGQEIFGKTLAFLSDWKRIGTGNAGVPSLAAFCGAALRLREEAEGARGKIEKGQHRDYLEALIEQWAYFIYSARNSVRCSSPVAFARNAEAAGYLGFDAKAKPPTKKEAA